MFKISHASSPLKEPNFYFRASAFDCTFFDLNSDGFYVCANLAGVLIFTIIRKGRNDIWNNTLVNPNGGFIGGPPRISSPLIYNMVKLLVECSGIKVSSAQQDKIVESLKANPQAGQAKSVGFRKLDKNIIKEI